MRKLQIANPVDGCDVVGWMDGVKMREAVTNMKTLKTPGRSCRCKGLRGVKAFDVIVGMYHDQVLTPLKTLFEYDAINITLGLPFLRISPDHGPNEKMLGKNLSNPLSLLKAIKFLDKN